MDSVAVTGKLPSQRDVLFYDGRCPVCRREAALFRRLSRPTLEVRDIHDVQCGNLQGREDLLRTLHLCRADGTMLRGVDANAAVWQHTSFGIPWRLITLPGVRVIAGRLYDAWARRRYRRLYACGAGAGRCL